MQFSRTRLSDVLHSEACAEEVGVTGQGLGSGLKYKPQARKERKDQGHKDHTRIQAQGSKQGAGSGLALQHPSAGTPPMWRPVSGLACCLQPLDGFARGDDRDARIAAQRQQVALVAGAQGPGSHKGRGQVLNINPKARNGVSKERGQVLHCEYRSRSGVRSCFLPPSMPIYHGTSLRAATGGQWVRFCNNLQVTQRKSAKDKT